ncbi:hypothetical protein Bbelb_292360 [Branchiostoma belcheri]|nr:hypothetical protein Bbelb_292360 [Branchiostoma belcheri]
MLRLVGRRNQVRVLGVRMKLTYGRSTRVLVGKLCFQSGGNKGGREAMSAYSMRPRTGTPVNYPANSSQQWPATNPNPTDVYERPRTGTPVNYPANSSQQWPATNPNPTDVYERPRTGTPVNYPANSSQQWPATNPNPTDVYERPRTGTPVNYPANSSQQWPATNPNPTDVYERPRTGTPVNYPANSSQQWPATYPNPTDVYHQDYTNLTKRVVLEHVGPLLRDKKGRLYRGRLARILIKDWIAQGRPYRGPLLKIIGQAVAVSIANSGATFPFLSPPVFAYMTQAEPQQETWPAETLLPRFLPDGNVRRIVEEVCAKMGEEDGKKVSFREGIFTALSFWLEARENADAPPGSPWKQKNGYSASPNTMDEPTFFTYFFTTRHLTGSPTALRFPIHGGYFLDIAITNSKDLGGRKLNRLEIH